MLHFAFRVLRWPPDAVWRATPREIAAALGGMHRDAEPLGGAELAALMNLYPDGR